MAQVKPAEKDKQRPKRSITHVPGQYLGYSLQATRLLDLLLDADPDWIVSLEVFEDVGVEKSDGTKIAEQDKSTLDGNPVSNLSINLWKTFANWTDAIANGELTLGATSFEIYVSRPVMGDIVTSFSKAKTEDDAKIALESAKQTLSWDHKENIRKDLLSHLERFFSSDEKTILKIIINFNFSTAKDGPTEDIKNKMNRWYPEDIIEDLLLYSLGWIKEKIDGLIEAKKPAYIIKSEFKTSITSFIRKIDRRAILNSFAHEPNEEEISKEMSVKKYVKQMQIIDYPELEVIHAIGDYLKSSVDRTKWSYKGYVNESSFQDFENNLVRIWTNKKRKIELSMKELEEKDKGQYLLSDCLLCKEKLEGMEVPDHFTPGSFHALADKEVVGWHPDYKTELSK